jgi:hypothetical protein
MPALASFICIGTVIARAGQTADERSNCCQRCYSAEGDRNERHGPRQIWRRDQQAIQIDGLLSSGEEREMVAGDSGGKRLSQFWCNLIDSKAPFVNAGIKQGLFGRGLTPRPGLAEAVRELNRYREQTTPKGLEKKGTPKKASVTKPGARGFAVTVDDVFHGSIQVTPPVPASGRVEAGTVLKVKAEPDSGYEIDSVCYAVVGYKGWTLYVESMTSPFEVKIDQNKRIGASFIKKSELEGFRVVQDVVYAQPGVKPLKYDVYSPDGAKALPCIVIIHGGG